VAAPWAWRCSFYPKLSPVRIVGSDLAHAVPSPLWLASATGSSGAWIGTLSGRYCSVPCQGSTSVATFAARIADRFLLPTLATMLMLLGLRLIAS
jgi:hypothetical protein